VTRALPIDATILVTAQHRALPAAVILRLREQGFRDVVTPDGPEPHHLTDQLRAGHVDAAVLSGDVVTDEVLEAARCGGVARVLLLPDGEAMHGSVVASQWPDLALVRPVAGLSALSEVVDSCVEVLVNEQTESTPAPVAATPATSPTSEPDTPRPGGQGNRWFAWLLAVTVAALAAVMAVSLGPQRSVQSLDVAVAVSARAYVAPPQEADARIGVVRAAQLVIDNGTARPEAGVTLRATAASDKVRLTAMSTQRDYDLTGALSRFENLVRERAAVLTVPSLPRSARILTTVGESRASTESARGGAVPAALRATLTLLALLVLLGRLSPRQAGRPARTVFAASVALAVGVAAASYPFGTMAIAVVAAALAAFRRGTWQVAGLAIVATAVSRPLVDAGVAPSWLNFVDLPLVALAAVRALPALRRSRPRRLTVLTVAVAVAAVGASWATSHVSPLRAVATAALVSQPWVLLAALRVDRPSSDRVQRMLLGLAIVVGVAQVPVAWTQAALRGVGDTVTGTYTGSTNAAHTTAAVSAVAMLLFGALALRALARGGRGPALRWALAGAACGSVMVLGDAKQLVLVLPVAAAALMIGLQRRVLLRVVAAFVVGAVGLGGLFVALNPQWRTGVRVFTEALSGDSGKAIGFTTVTAAMDDPAAWAVGLGPGTTVSRVALLSGDALARPDSPVASLPLNVQPVTQEVIEKTLPRTIQASSFQSGWSSALGILGDFGLLGALAYLLAIGCAIRCMWGRWTPLRAAARSACAAAVLLAFIDSWLEQSAFTLPLMALVAVASTTGVRSPP
jgi:hypothetical protein